MLTSVKSKAPVEMLPVGSLVQKRGENVVVEERGPFDAEKPLNPRFFHQEQAQKMPKAQNSAAFTPTKHSTVYGQTRNPTSALQPPNPPLTNEEPLEDDILSPIKLQRLPEIFFDEDSQDTEFTCSSQPKSPAVTQNKTSIPRQRLPTNPLASGIQPVTTTCTSSAIGTSSSYQRNPNASGRTSRLNSPSSANFPQNHQNRFQASTAASPLNPKPLATHSTNVPNPNNSVFHSTEGGISSYKGLVRQESRFIGRLDKFGTNLAWQQRTFTIDNDFFLCYRPTPLQRKHASCYQLPSSVQTCIPDTLHQRGCSFYEPKWIIPFGAVKEICILVAKESEYEVPVSRLESFLHCGCFSFGPVQKPSGKELARLTGGDHLQEFQWHNILEEFLQKQRVDLSQLPKIVSACHQRIFLVRTLQNAHLMRARNDSELSTWLVLLCAKKILFL